MKNNQYHPCPICASPVQHFSRYPKQICFDCCNNAYNAQGQKVSFFNTSLSGGFVAITADEQESEEHICFINGVQCWAEEAHLGGIVIQPL